MSSSDEGSVWGAEFGPEGGERASVPHTGPGAPRGRGEGEGEGEGKGKGKGKGGLPDQPGHQSDSDSDREAIGAWGKVLWGSKGLPVFPGMLAHEGADTLAFGPHLAVESAPIVQKLLSRQARGARRFRSPLRSASKLSKPSAIRGKAEAGPIGRGALAPSCVEAQQASAATHLHASGPEGGRDWGNPKRGTKSRMMVSEAAQPPSSDHESSDEFTEIQLIRVSICLQEGGRIKSISPREPGDTARHLNAHVREIFLHTQGSLPTSAPRGLTTAVERQASGELEAPSSKKMHCIVWGKGGSRPSYPGAAAAAVAAAAAGDLPRATAREKAIQEKNPLGDSSRVTLGRSFPSWGQRLKAAHPEPASFPPISGVPLLGRAKSYSLLPLGPKQSKHQGTGKRSVARGTRESQPVAREDSHPYGDGVLQAQLLTHSPGPATLCINRGEFSSGDPNTRAPQPPGNAHLLALTQGALRLRGPTSSGDQEPPVQPPVPERQQQAPGAQGCPRCVVLQKERDDLKEQLAVMQSLIEKFQALGC